MKKVINITLGSIVFAIEKDAYDTLAAYLEQIKNNLANSDDETEIIADIESAIAEKFIARKRSEKFAVTTDDVALVISEMGNPVDFGEAENTEEQTDTTSTTKPASAELKKRLYRDTDNSIIAGVASGLAQYFDIDPVVVRLAFVISVFFSGLGILAYIILWLVVPVATTTADKYAMRGERVTLKEISERVKKNIQDVESVNVQSAKNTWTSLRGLLDKVFRVLGTVATFIITIARFVVGIAFVVGGSLGIAGMVSIYSVILLSDKVLFPADVQMVLEMLQGSALGIIAMTSSFVMMLVPLIILIVTGASLLAKRNFFTVQKSVTLAVVWIVAVVVAGTTAALQVEQVMQKIGPMENRATNARFEVEREAGYMYRYKDEVPAHPTPEVYPERITVIGTYNCLDERAVTNPPDECRSGIRTADGLMYSLDFMLMSQILPALQTGEPITVSGVFTPTERLSASVWADLGVAGIVSVTSMRKGTE